MIPNMIANKISPRIVMLSLRIAQFTFAFLILILSAYVANWYRVDVMTSPPPQIGWLLFLASFTILCIGYLEGVSRFAPRLYHPYAAFAVEVAMPLSYLGGFIALAVYLHYVNRCRSSVCGAARTDVAFAVFELLLWIATSVMMGQDIFKRGVRNPNAMISATVAKAKAAEMA
ncbi:membrane-associating domain-containing protein [Xylariaceae sp. FL1272]|nr:membrane-associating domain-containing protein [Xylariaceae sp. FL1272]